MSACVAKGADDKLIAFSRASSFEKARGAKVTDVPQYVKLNDTTGCSLIRSKRSTLADKANFKDEPRRTTPSKVQYT